MQKVDYGYVDRVQAGTVAGWISDEFLPEDIFVALDGKDQQCFVTLHARDDLVDVGIHGVGFEASFPMPAQAAELSVKLRQTSDDGTVTFHLLPTSNSTVDLTINPGRFRSAFVSAEELNDIAKAIPSDTQLYLNFVSRFAHVVGVVSAPVDVLFIDGTANSVSVRYRIINVADGLRELGYTTRYISLADVSLSVAQSIQARTVVFFRAPFTEEYRHLEAVHRARGARIVFDMDDLVIDPDIIANIDGVKYLDHRQTAEYHRGMGLYRDFARAADIVTCSTNFLVDHVEAEFKGKGRLVRNTIGKGYLDAYSGQNGQVRPDRFVIGYYSGSKTHQRDFAVAYRGLVKFMQRYPDTTLRIVGMLDLVEFPDLAALGARIEFVDVMPYHRMIDDLANCSVVIAPLEIGDPFCESKSELKFFEAALRRVPCIASPTATYAQAMRDGEFGALPRSDETWFEALETLLLSASTAAIKANSAFRHAIETYSYKVAGAQAEAAYFGPLRPAVERTGFKDALRLLSARPNPPTHRQPLSLGVIIPDVVIGGGGHRKILRFCRDWQREGHAITLYVDTFRPLERVRLEINTHFFEFEHEIRTFRGFVGEHDALIATHWTTAYSLRDYALPERVFYFVQDFEPMFSSVSTDYVKALATYSMGFNIVPFGRWVDQRLQQEVGAKTLPVHFTVDLERYRHDESIHRNIDVLFFARPSQPRRCFELGVAALELLFRENPAVRIGLYGEHDYGTLPFRYHNFGLVKDLSQLAQVYNRTKVGICFSTTNPSSVGYEMLSCGTCVLDIRVPGWQLNFGGDEFVYYADPTQESVAAVLADALKDRAGRERRVRQGIEFVSKMKDDALLSGEFMAHIEKALKS